MCNLGFISFSGLRELSFFDYLIIFSVPRFSTGLLPFMFSYPRESGTGKFYAENMKRNDFILSLFFVMIPVVFSGPFYILYIIISIVVSYFVGRWSKKMIGGYTGDVIGFTIELNTLILILISSINFRVINA